MLNVFLLLVYHAKHILCRHLPRHLPLLPKLTFALVHFFFFSYAGNIWTFRRVIIIIIAACLHPPRYLAHSWRSFDRGPVGKWFLTAEFSDFLIEVALTPKQKKGNLDDTEINIFALPQSPPCKIYKHQRTKLHAWAGILERHFRSEPYIVGFSLCRQHWNPSRRRDRERSER